VLPESEDGCGSSAIAAASSSSRNVWQTLRGDRVVVLLTITFPPESADLETSGEHHRHHERRQGRMPCSGTGGPRRYRVTTLGS